MGRLIHSEWIKLRKSLGYKILLLCSGGSGLLLGILFATVGIDDQMTGYRIYLDALGEIQMQITFAGIYAAIFIGNEFYNRTFGMGIVSGCSRSRLLMAKITVFFAGLLLLLILYPVISAASISVFLEFGVWNTQTAAHLLTSTLLALIGYLAVGGFCILLAIWIKNIGGIIGAALGGVSVLQLLIMALNTSPTLGRISKLIFSYQIVQVSEPESIPLFLGVCLVTLFAALAASFLIFRKSELK